MEFIFLLQKDPRNTKYSTEYTILTIQFTAKFASVMCMSNLEVKDRSAYTRLDVIKNNIKVGMTIYSDC